MSIHFSILTWIGLIYSTLMVFGVVYALVLEPWIQRLKLSIAHIDFSMKPALKMSFASMLVAVVYHLTKSNLK
jgi:hypothetical protein